MTANAAAYIRVSTAGQADQYGPEVQRRDIEAYAMIHNLTVVNWYEDHHSGLDLWERPEMNRLRDDFQSGQFQAAIFWRCDRLSRDPAHMLIVMAEADRHGVEILSVHDEIDKSESGQLLNYIKGFIGKKEVEAIRQRTQSGRKARVQSGKLTATKYPSYGYVWRDATRSAFNVCPDTSPIVVRIFDEKASDVALRQIAKRLTSDGIPTPSGKSSTWEISSVAAILKNERYTGRAKAWRGEIELPAGTIPPIISPAVFGAAQDALTRGKANAPRNMKDPDGFLLRNGFAFCGHCGRQMASKDGYHQHVAKDGTISRYDQKQYHCAGRKGAAGTCDGRPTVRSPWLDAEVWEKITQPLRTPDALIAMLVAQRGADPTESGMKTIDRLLAETQKKVVNLTRSIAATDDDEVASTLLSDMKAHVERRRMLEIEASTLRERQQQWQTAGDDLDALMTFAGAMRDSLDGLDNDTKRLLLTALGVKVTVFKSGHSPRYEITASIPLDIPAPEQAVDILLAPTGTEGLVSSTT